MEAVAYTRLYFDINHNGDLTDDQVIESKSDRGMPVGYAAAVFPTVNLTIDVEGCGRVRVCHERVFAWVVAIRLRQCHAPCGSLPRR